MAEDMIERVARRLWDHSFDRMPDPPWEQTSELQKRFNRMLAREAIAEMREPSDEMLETALDVSGQRVAPFTAPRESGVATECDLSEEDAADINESLRAAHCETYVAMIDAALAAPKQPGAT